MSGYCDDCGNTICLCDDTPRSEIVGTNEFFQKYRIIDRIALEKLESELAKANAEAETWKRHHAALDRVCEVYKEENSKLIELARMVENNSLMPHKHDNYYTRLCCLSERASEVLKELREK